MHAEQMIFCLEVRKKFETYPNPGHFCKAKVLDVGSLDINGNNRFLFVDCDYFGIDLVAGKNVNMAIPMHDFVYSEFCEEYNTVICTEVLEHDRYWKATFQAMHKVLIPHGLLIMTCAGPKRPRHGVTECCPEDSPLTNDYYRNLSIDDVYEVMSGLFLEHDMVETRDGKDLYFWGIKA